MSLVDKVETTPSTTPDAKTSATPPVADAGSPPVMTSNDWYYDNDIKGNGNRPEFLKEKYKTVADQAKAYVEVEKKLGAFKGAPEQYDLSLEGYPDLKFSQDDPMFKDFLEGAKKNGVSQEYVTELLSTYAQALTANIPDPDAELQKLGPNGKQDLQILSQWANNTFSPSEVNIFNNMLTTADAVRFFEKVRSMTTEPPVAQPSSSSVTRETVDQVKQLVNDPRYDKDPTFRDEVRMRMANAMGVKQK